MNVDLTDLEIRKVLSATGTAIGRADRQLLRNASGGNERGREAARVTANALRSARAKLDAVLRRAV